MKIKSLLKLPQNVWSLGWVSFFNDVSSEMIYPLLPLFLTQGLGCRPCGGIEAGNSLWGLSFLHRDGNAPRKPSHGTPLEDHWSPVGLLIRCRDGLDRCALGNHSDGRTEKK